MSRWNHSLCDECWDKREPTRKPLRVLDSQCCQCGTQHKSGIFVRADPDAMPCKGEGDEHAEDN